PSLPLPLPPPSLLSGVGMKSLSPPLLVPPPPSLLLTSRRTAAAAARRRFVPAATDPAEFGTASVTAGERRFPLEGRSAVASASSGDDAAALRPPGPPLPSFCL
ncbi:unnamed protein product, partial [Ectocarpus sp. 12 AP-2014]